MACIIIHLFSRQCITNVTDNRWQTMAESQTLAYSHHGAAVVLEIVAAILENQPPWPIFDNTVHKKYRIIATSW